MSLGGLAGSGGRCTNKSEAMFTSPTRQHTEHLLSAGSLPGPECAAQKLQGSWGDRPKQDDDTHTCGTTMVHMVLSFLLNTHGPSTAAHLSRNESVRRKPGS